MFAQDDQHPSKDNQRSAPHHLAGRHLIKDEVANRQRQDH